MAKAAQQGATRRVVDFDELYPGRFIKASEFKGKTVTLKISDVYMEELEGDKGKEWKCIVSFERTDKKWVCNKTNGFCLMQMFGRVVAKWVGKRVTLYPAEFEGEPCIRVWGSPDLDSDRDIDTKIGRRRLKCTLRAVRPAAVPAAAARAPEPEPEPETPHDPDTGEVTGDPEPQGNDPF